MENGRTSGSTARTLAAGAIAGAAAGAVAALVARVAMRIFAVGIGQPVELTLPGTSVVLFAGMTIGLPLGALFALLRTRLPGPAVVLGPVSMLAVFGLIFLPALIGGVVDEAGSAQLLAAVLFAGVAAVLGLVLGVLEPPIERRMNAAGREAALVTVVTLPGAALGGILVAQITIESWAGFLETLGV